MESKDFIQAVQCHIEKVKIDPLVGAQILGLDWHWTLEEGNQKKLYSEGTKNAKNDTVRNNDTDSLSIHGNLRVTGDYFTVTIQATCLWQARLILASISPTFASSTTTPNTNTNAFTNESHNCKVGKDCLVENKGGDDENEEQQLEEELKFHLVIIDAQFVPFSKHTNDRQTQIDKKVHSEIRQRMKQNVHVQELLSNLHSTRDKNVVSLTQQLDQHPLTLCESEIQVRRWVKVHQDGTTSMWDPMDAYAVASKTNAHSCPTTHPTTVPSITMPMDPRNTRSRIKHQEERFHVQSNLLLALHSTLFSKLDGIFDVLELLLDLPYLPRRTSMKSFSLDNDSKRYLMHDLSERTALCLLEDVLADQCVLSYDEEIEQEGEEDKILQDLNLSDQETHDVGEEEEEEERGGERSTKGQKSHQVKRNRKA